MTFIPNVQGIRVTGRLTGITSIESVTISATTYLNLPPSTGATFWTSGASGNFSLKVINNTTTEAYGDYAYSEGRDSIASGNTAHAEGYFTKAFGFASHAEGTSTEATGAISHAEGQGTKAIGDWSHAEGLNTIASGQTSHAEGFLTEAFGVNSHAEGQNTTASGLYSHAEGINSVASGNTSHAQGRGNIAGGDYSHAGGDASTALGLLSFIHSKNSVVTGERSVLLGGQNMTGATDDTVYVPNLNINILSTGTSVNNLGIDSSGNVIIGGAGSGGNATVDNFYYQVSNSVDTRPVFSDSNITIGWDETGNDLEFTMDVAPLGSGDMRSLAYLVGGATNNEFITTVGAIVDLYPTGVAAGERMEAFVTSENDEAYPAYKITTYNAGESYKVSIWIERITKN